MRIPVYFCSRTWGVLLLYAVLLLAFQCRRIKGNKCDGASDWKCNDGRCFCAVDDRKLNWYMSKAYCRNLDAYLASIKNPADETFIQVTLLQASTGGRNYMFVGATDAASEGTWLWIADNSLVTYTNWRVGEPNDINGGEDCCVLSDGGWNDGVCTNQDNFICERQQVDGVWGTWGTWGQCSVTCDLGSQSRTRACDSPAPVYGGQLCGGGDTTTADCNPVSCPVDGVWGTWGTWGQCSVTCDLGSQSRTRACDSPAPVYGGQLCGGGDTSTADCNPVSCPVDGVWGTWGTWGQCSVTCDLGSKSRTRACDSPAPVYGGQLCDGGDTSTADCNPRPCPVDGSWATWRTWSACSVINSDVTRTRCRKCINPVPQHGGASCEGNVMHSERCPLPTSSFKRKCRCRRVRMPVITNVTKTELQAMMAETKEELTVDKSTTTLAIRKKISAPDVRNSSMVMGGFAIIILSLVLFCVVSFDLISLYQVHSKR